MWTDIVTVNGTPRVVSDALFAPRLALWVRAAAAPDGTMAAVAQGEGDLVEVADSRGQRWLGGVRAFGTSPVAIAAHPLGWEVTWMEHIEGHAERNHGSTWGRVVLNAQLQEVSPRTWQPTGFGNTAGGMLDAPVGGAPIFTDPNRKRLIHGLQVHLPMTRGAWTVGQHPTQPAILAHDAQADALWLVKRTPTDTQTPSHLTLDGDGQPVVLVAHTAEPIYRRDFTPWAVAAPPPPPQVLTGRKPFPRPLWLAPYQSFNANAAWGDTQDFVGNAILVTDTAANTERLAALGKPFIVAPQAHSPRVESSIVAYWVSGHDIDGLGQAVEAVRRGGLPEKPVIAYLDKRGWPDQKPAWLDPAVVWPSPQCYRDPGESLAGFDAAVRADLGRLDEWGCSLVPTVHAYDRNGLGTEAEALEALQAAYQWVWDYRVVGLLPFSDMRRGTLDGQPIGGMEVYPSLRAIVRGFALLMPEDRPNRWSYWTPRRTDITTVLRNILGQSRELVALSPERKQYLLSRL